MSGNKAFVFPLPMNGNMPVRQGHEPSFIGGTDLWMGRHMMWKCHLLDSIHLVCLLLMIQIAWNSWTIPPSCEEGMEDTRLMAGQGYLPSPLCLLLPMLTR